MRPRLAPVLAGASFLALLAPAALHFLLPEPSPERLIEHVRWSRVLGFLLAAGAVATAAWRARRDAPGARRVVVALGVVGAFVTLAAAAPLDDDALKARMEDAYVGSGGLSAYDDGRDRRVAFRQWQGDEVRAVNAALFHAVARDGHAPAALDLGPYPGDPGDRWTVRVGIHGPFEAGYRSPDLVPPAHVACEPVTDTVSSWVSPLRGEGSRVERSLHELHWECTLLRGGDAAFRLDLHESGRNVTAFVSAYPTFRLHFLQVLDTGFIMVGPVLAVGSALVLANGARRPRQSDPAAHALAAGAVAGLAVTWACMFWLAATALDVYLGRQNELALLGLLWTVFAIAAAILGGVAARAWHRAPESSRALDFSRLAALFACVALPLGPFLPIGVATESFLLAFAHMAGGVLVAGVVTADWWRDARISWRAAR